MSRRRIAGKRNRGHTVGQGSMRLPLALGLCFLALTGCLAEYPAWAQQAAAAADALATVVPALRSQTSVPILLPQKLPPLYQKAYYPHVKGDADGYTVRIDSDPDCDGANACFLGLLRAKRGGRYSFPEVVNLGAHETGRYKPITCGGSCSAATIEWKYEGVLYIAQMNLRTESEKVARAQMIELAKSAVQSGPR